MEKRSGKRLICASLAIAFFFGTITASAQEYQETSTEIPMDVSENQPMNASTVTDTHIYA